MTTVGRFPTSLPQRGSFFFVRFHAKFQAETSSQNLGLVRRKISQYLAYLLAELPFVAL